MSEYQYYEFQALDRRLTDEEQRAVARLSSRVDPHPRRAIFTYSWSDFPGSAKEVLAQYYDAMLYMANWGSLQLMFRFPQGLVDLESMQQYQVQTLDYPSDALTVSTMGEHVLLDVRADEEEGFGWIEGEGWLDALVGLRDDLLRGDYRLLYLAWLKGMTVDYDVDEEALEPPVPPGLAELTPALETFVDLFRLDDALIEVAAEHSSGRETISEAGMRQAIAALPPQEKDAFLLRLAQDEPLLSLALKRRLGLLSGPPSKGAASRRTVEGLLAAAEALRERQRREQAARAEARRIAELESLAQREAQVWQEVEALIQEGKAKPYDEAVRLLVELRDLARYQKREAAFQDRLDRIWEVYSRRRALLRRLRQAGLVTPNV